MPRHPELPGSVYTGRRRGQRGRKKGNFRKISPLELRNPSFLSAPSHMEAVLGDLGPSPRHGGRDLSMKGGRALRPESSTAARGQVPKRLWQEKSKRSRWPRRR